MQLQRIWEGIRSSLFYVPLALALLGAVLAEVALLVDANIGPLPDRLTATVDSARSVLGVIASATLTFAGIAFSVSLLLVSAASSQFSPRVVHGLFRDPFNKRVMGVVIGTFVYCLVVMRAVRGPLEEAGVPVVPSISVLVAVVLGLAAILSIVAFIDHNAHRLEVSQLLHDVTEDALEQVRRLAPGQWSSDAEVPETPRSAFAVTFDEQGWVQAVDNEGILRSVPAGTTVTLVTTAGRYAISGTAICHVTPEPDDPEGVTTALRRAVVVGPSRNMHQDDTFGVRQLADVALKALSPGINDPTTAQDALFHMASVVRELLVQPSRGRQLAGADGRLLLAAETPDAHAIVGLAFDEVRLAAVGQPTVLIYLLEILRLLVDSLPPDTSAAAITSLDSQARLILAVAELGELPEADRARVRVAYAERFVD